MLGFLKSLIIRDPEYVYVADTKALKRAEAVLYAAIPIVNFESFRSTAYSATKAEKAKGIYTIGFGETNGVKAGDKITYAEAVAKLKTRIEGFIADLERLNPELFTMYTPMQIGGLCSLIYNVGEGNFTGGQTYKAFLAGDVDGVVASGFHPTKGFVKQNGKILNGLVDRREKESTLLTFNEER